MKVYKYYYNLLSAERQSVYKALYNGLRAHSRYIDIGAVDIDAVDIGQVMQCVSLDNPLFFYVDFLKITVREFSAAPNFGGMRAHAGSKYQLIPKYTYSRAEVTKLNADMEVALNKIVAAINGSRDYIKALRAHDILARAVKYDTVALTNNLANYKRTNTVVGALLDKKAVCEGIAKAYKLVLDALDIPCVVVTGATSDENLFGNAEHGWNVVYADNAYFHVDLTGDVCGTTRGNICRAYFGLSDRQISVDHRPSADAPKCTTEGCDFYTKAGLVAQSQADVKRIVQEAVARNDRKATMRMPNNCFADNNQLLEFVQKILAQSVKGVCRVECSVNQKFGVYTFSWK